jgi:Protein of unknown function (DUF2829)
MNFGEALQAMKNGKKVRRQLWVDENAPWRGIYAAIMTMPAPFEPQIVVGYPGKDELRPFAGSQWDLLSEDWEIVD